MREYEFRGRRVDNNEWIYGSLVVANDNINNGKCYILPHITDFSYGDNGNRCRIGCFIEVDGSTVGQYTGVKDKNDVKIFEGDILQGNWYSYEEPTDSIFGIVEYFEGWCAFIIHDHEMDVLAELTGNGSYHYDFEVNGNIYENPEILQY